MITRQNKKPLNSYKIIQTNRNEDLYCAVLTQLIVGFSNNVAWLNSNINTKLWRVIKNVKLLFVTLFCKHPDMYVNIYGSDYTNSIQNLNCNDMFHRHVESRNMNKLENKFNTEVVISIVNITAK